MKNFLGREEEEDDSLDHFFIFLLLLLLSPCFFGRRKRQGFAFLSSLGTIHGRRRRSLYALAIQGAQRRGASVRKKKEEEEEERWIDGNEPFFVEQMPSALFVHSSSLARTNLALSFW